VFGNPANESALRILISEAKNIHHLMQVGISGNDAVFFNSTAYIKASDIFSKRCFPYGHYRSVKEADQILNSYGPVMRKKNVSEICKFFSRAVTFNDAKLSSGGTKCNSAFDFLYLEYRYWDYTTSMLSMKTEFENFKTILGFMNLLKCNFTCIKKIEAEFLPSNLFKLQGWTAIDQITDADPMIDRIVLPAFTSDALGVFDHVCRNLHFISDRFSKPGSEIFIELSAESQAFTNCQSITGTNYLGDYLNGTTTPSGNIQSVESKFLDKFNDPLYMCSNCSCFAYDDNHHSAALPYANILAGSLWRDYSFMKNNNLNRHSITDRNVINNKIVLVQLFDISGKLISAFKDLLVSTALQNYIKADGIYFIKSTFDNGEITVTKKILFKNQ
jgi:hypothetical protein